MPGAIQPALFYHGTDGPNQESCPMCLPALLPDKDGLNYLKKWTQIKALVSFQAGLPNSVISDLKKAVLKTMGTMFPEAAIRGCHFHHKQAIRGNIQSKGL